VALTAAPGCPKCCGRGGRADSLLEALEYVLKAVTIFNPNPVPLTAVFEAAHSGIKVSRFRPED